MRGTEYLRAKLHKKKKSKNKPFMGGGAAKKNKPGTKPRGNKKNRDCSKNLHTELNGNGSIAKVWVQMAKRKKKRVT